MRERVWFCVIVGLAAVVRTVGVGRLDIGTDEAQSFLTVTSARGIFAELLHDTNPPLYFFVLKGWVALFGTSLVAMRMLSVVLGVAAVAALGGLARQCGASKRTVMWVLALAAFSPVQLHYGQMARGYTLCGLVGALGLWTFVYAMQKGGAGAWLRHGLVVGISVWTHALFLPVAAGYALVALLMRATRGQWRGLAGAYGVAAVVGLPAGLLVWHQMATSGGAAWLRAYWLATPPALAIPKSLALLAFGGDMPRYLLALPLWRPAQVVALGVLGVAVGAFFWPGVEKETGAAQGDARELGRWRWLVVVFTFWPLVFLWGYSEVREPLYLVGRYDVFAQGAYLVLVAAGLSRTQAKMGRGAWLLAVTVGGILAGGLAGRWEFPLDPQVFHHAARVAYVAGETNGGAGIVCTGLEASPTMYWLAQRGLSLPVETVPRETKEHIGWLNSDAELEARRGEWEGEIVAALDAAGAGGRVWIFEDAAVWNWTGDFVPSARQELALQVVPVALAHGWRLVEGDGRKTAAEGALRIVRLERVGG